MLCPAVPLADDFHVFCLRLLVYALQLLSNAGGKGAQSHNDGISQLLHSSTSVLALSALQLMAADAVKFDMLLHVVTMQSLAWCASITATAAAITGTCTCMEPAHICCCSLSYLVQELLPAVQKLRSVVT